MRVIGNVSKLIMLFIVCSFALSLSSCGSKVPNYNWSLQYPMDIGIYDIVALDANHVWAVGELGTVLFYDGNQWTKQESGTDKDLVSVSGSPPSTVWAVGYAIDRNTPGSGPGTGTVLSYKNEAWVEMESPENHIFDVAVSDNSHAWIVGACNIYLWDGSTYTETGVLIYVPHDLFALDSTHVWAGEKAAIGLYNGQNWEYTDILDITPKDRELSEFPVTSINAADTNNVWGVGPNGNIYFFNGDEWTYQNSGTDVDLRDVEAIDPKHVWATGVGGMVLFYNGEKWSTVDSLKDYWFHDIAASDNDHVWAIGQGGIYFGTPAEK